MATLSVPVEPIVYHLDPGTPEPVRSALLDGAAWWNDAFTAAGWEGLIPYPTDFQTPTHQPETFDFAVGTAAVRNWLHEYVGIAAYQITGRASAVSDAQR